MLNIFSCVCYLYIYFGDMTFSTFYEFIFNYFCCCFVLFSYAEFENSLFILIQILYQICNFQIIFFQFATFFLTVYFKNFLIWMAFILSIFFFDVSCFGLISKKSLPKPKSKKKCVLCFRNFNFCVPFRFVFQFLDIIFIYYVGHESMVISWHMDVQRFKELFVKKTTLSSINWPATMSKFSCLYVYGFLSV